MTGEEVKALRMSKKLQRQELADLLDIGVSTLYRYEKSDDDVPGWLKYAVVAICGSVVVEIVTADRQRKQKKIAAPVRSNIGDGGSKRFSYL